MLPKLHFYTVDMMWGKGQGKGWGWHKGSDWGGDWGKGKGKGDWGKGEGKGWNGKGVLGERTCKSVFIMGLG